MICSFVDLLICWGQPINKLTNGRINKLELFDIEVLGKEVLHFFQLMGEAGIVALVVKLQHETADEGGIGCGFNFQVVGCHAAGDDLGANAGQDRFAEGFGGDDANCRDFFCMPGIGSKIRP